MGWYLSMSRVKFEWENLGFKSSLEDDSVETLSKVLDAFELFLKGAGFELDGKLDVIPEHEYYGEVEKFGAEDMDNTQKISIDMGFIKE